VKEQSKSTRKKTQEEKEKAVLVILSEKKGTQSEQTPVPQK